MLRRAATGPRGAPAQHLTRPHAEQEQRPHAEREEMAAPGGAAGEGGDRRSGPN